MSSPTEGSPIEGGAGRDEKPRLTDDQKKQNHIASEQKRRQAIRERYDRLTEIVPGLEGLGRSEGLVLKRTVEFIRETLAERQALVDQVEQVGGKVDEKLKRQLYSSAGIGVNSKG